MCFKLKKPLYGLKQASKAWHERLSNFLLENGFSRGHADTILFRKLLKNEILIVQIYVKDIIFSSTNTTICQKNSKMMQTRFIMSMMG